MFRMEFQSLDPVEETDEPFSTGRSEEECGTRVYEQFRQSRAAENEDSPPKIYEGRVGRFGKMQRVVSSNHAVNRTVADLPQVLIRSVSTNDSSPKKWVDADLIDFESPKAGARQEPEFEAPADPVIISELVKPFAESVNISEVSSVQNQSGSWDLLTDGVQAADGLAGSSPSTASVQLRSNSTRSTSSTSVSDTSDAESSSIRDSAGHEKEEEKGSPASRAYNRAFNKIMQRKSKAAVPDAQKVSKPWDEPLLAVHEQAKLDRKLQKEAKIEALRLVAEANRDAEIQQRELLALANPVPESVLSNNNHKKDLGVRKGIQKLFHIHGGTHSNQNTPKEAVVGDVREAKLVMPRRGFIESSLSSPSTATAVAVSQIKTGPRSTARKDITFATVESNQRDVQPWTMEEYMTRNARLEEWKERKDDEEFGGIENNLLFNQYFDTDFVDDLDSDSD